MDATNGRLTYRVTDRPGYRYDDISDLIDDSLQELARRRAKWPGDDLQAVTLLASLVEAAEQALIARVTIAHENRHSWADIAEALGSSGYRGTPSVRAVVLPQLEGAAAWAA